MRRAAAEEEKRDGDESPKVDSAESTRVYNDVREERRHVWEIGHVYEREEYCMSKRDEEGKRKKEDGYLGGDSRREAKTRRERATRKKQE